MGCFYCCQLICVSKLECVNEIIIFKYTYLLVTSPEKKLSQKFINHLRMRLRILSISHISVIILTGMKKKEKINL